MLTVTITVEINRPIESVFAYTTDRANLPYWFVGVLAAEQDGINQIGTKATITGKLLGFTFSTTSEVVAYEPNHVFAIKGEKPFPFLERETFTRKGDSTQVEYHGTYNMRGFYGMLGPMLRWMLQRQLTASYGRLKAVLEDEGGD